MPLVLSPDRNPVSQMGGEAGEVGDSELGSQRQEELGLNCGSTAYLL